MISSIFLNLPVADVARSRSFFEGIGFSINEAFSGADGLCVVVSSNISVMLTHKDKFKAFMDKEIAPQGTSEVFLSLECGSEDEIKGICEKAFELGARKVNEYEENEAMASWGFEDLDGHLWDLFTFRRGA